MFTLAAVIAVIDFSFEAFMKDPEDREILPADRQVDGQTFVAFAAVPYTRLDGGLTRLISWRSHCATCGAEFEFQLGERVSRFPLRRGCDAHRRKLATAVRLGRFVVTRPDEIAARRLRREERAALVRRIYAAKPRLQRVFPDGLPDYVLASEASANISHK